jgi:hypothetical protein
VGHAVFTTCANGGDQEARRQAGSQGQTGGFQGIAPNGAGLRHNQHPQPEEQILESRCIVPFNSFSEFNKAEGGDIWFALDETRPLACFAPIAALFASTAHECRMSHAVLRFVC